ncbi:LppU/SCO3897 family protein [Polymorphospora rubra]|uniref:Uncharacterized protein n=1 Tax=Polymorphospora rubra TaxID=338584 RepID=A0A810MWG2_9ACTN|nr:hypothetical protein [Polymorphospora rubra]BCJ65531.1 hypothetical protein Prubr_25520 [Polymorphospora rubra]
MSSYGPPGPGQPDDPYNQQPQYGGYPPPPPTSGPGGYPPPPSSYPPPGDPYGQPGDPYGQPGDPYGQPGDPYGQPVSGGYPPPPPPTAQWGQPGPVGYQPPPAPPRRGGGGKIALIIGLVVLLMLALCGVGVWWLLRDTDQNAQPTPTASAPVDPSGDPSGEPSPSASPSSASPSPSPSSDSGTFAKGDCVVNDGTADDAELRKVPCGPDTYEVLSRIPFTTDGEKCKTDPIFGDPDSDANYTHDNPIDAADYVLCLKKR